MGSDSEPKVDARQLLAELDFPHAEGLRKELIEVFADGVDALMHLLASAGGPSKGGGELAFAINHLLARSISDLVAGVHLGSHVYLQQAHSVMRPVFESLDLINLFATDPDQAERWVNAEMPGKEFSPRQVREKLGKDKPDEVYGHFSEVGPHPRFIGAQLTGGMLVTPDGEDRTALFRIGPYFPKDPRSLHPYLWGFQSLIGVSFAARHLELVSDRVSHATWLITYLEVVRAAAEGCRKLRAAFIELDAGEGTEFLETIYDELLERVEAGETRPPEESAVTDT